MGRSFECDERATRLPAGRRFVSGLNSCRCHEIKRERITIPPFDSFVVQTARISPYVTITDRRRHLVVWAPVAACHSGCWGDRCEGVAVDSRSQLKPSDLSETGRRQLLHTLGEQNVSVASLTFPLRRPLHDEEQLDARLAAIKQAMQFAWELKSRVLVCRIGRIVEEAESAEGVRQREVLGELARHGNHVGVTLAITPSGDSRESLGRLLSSIDDGPLGIDFDPAERIMSRQDPIASLRDLHGHVSHVTVRDALRDADGLGQETVIGRGEVDWDELLATIDEMNYDGWLTVDRRAGEDRLGDMTRAVSFLRNVAGP